MVKTFGNFLGSLGEVIDMAGFVSISLLWHKNLKNPLIDAIFLTMLEGLISFLASYFV